MRTAFLFGVVLTVALVVRAGAQSESGAGDDVLDMLVWGPDRPVASRTYSDELRGEVEGYLLRASRYCSRTPIVSTSDVELARAARINYACRLAAVSEHREGPRLAAGYVEGLEPCYEWEGFHDCPEREALFADKYQLSHLDGPFKSYLPLLAAHRWLCTAEAYEAEGRSEQAYLSRKWFELRLSLALRSETLLIRSAAERLSVRKRCH